MKATYNSRMSTGQDRSVLQQLAAQAMTANNLATTFLPEALAELAAVKTSPTDPGVRDQRALLWCSIDNDDSRDLDQLSVGEALPGGATKVLVAIADVDALVRKGSALDRSAQQNTTSVYTSAQIFPMLPERVSTDLTSLSFDQDRLAVVIEMTLAADGTLAGSDVYRSLVHNKAKLAYNSVAAWLDATGTIPAAIAAVPGLDANIRLQSAAAQQLKALRHAHGALDFESIEARPVFDGDMVSGLRGEKTNTAKQLIEDLMISSNGVTARLLDAKKFPSIRRIVRIPKRWDRIVELAAERGTTLPAQPDSLALNQFLQAARAADPIRFPDLSLSVIKLMGSGEYAVEMPGAGGPGHFGLAVRDYAHSTAPNRRYPDLITQRLIKAALAGQPVPYTQDELAALARHCTDAEDAAKKVERQVEKSAAAMLLQHHIGETFDAIVTGVTVHGTFVRLLNPPVEGMLYQGADGVDVGMALRVRLLSTNIARGFIDFARV